VETSGTLRAKRYLSSLRPQMGRDVP
jgi:hypothetical protein